MAFRKPQVELRGVGVPAEASFKLQDKFIWDLLNEVPPETRAFMIGDPAKALLPRVSSLAGGNADPSSASIPAP